MKDVIKPIIKDFSYSIFDKDIFLYSIFFVSIVFLMYFTIRKYLSFSRNVDEDLENTKAIRNEYIRLIKHLNAESELFYEDLISIIRIYLDVAMICPWSTWMTIYELSLEYPYLKSFLYELEAFEYSLKKDFSKDKAENARRIAIDFILNNKV